MKFLTITPHNYMEDHSVHYTTIAKQPNPWGGRERVPLAAIDLTPYQKTWIGANLLSNRKNQQFFIETYGLKKSVLSKWTKEVEKHGSVYGKPGAPRKIDSPEAKRHIVDKRSSRLQTREEDFDQVLEAARETGSKRGKSSFESSKMCPKTKLMYEAKYGIKTGAAEVTTTARQVACEDVRNFITFGCMNGYMVPNTPLCLVCNMDATAFTVGKAIDGKTIVKYFVKEEGVPLKAAPGKKTKGDPTGLFTIKYYLIMGAAGNVSVPVYVFQDDRMSETDVEIHKVMGLGIGTDVTSSGYMVFMKSRAGNKAFFSWLNTDVIIPYVNDVRKAYDLTKEDPVWFQLDGEDIQIKIYDDKEFLKVLDAENIIVGKPSGSTTEKTQPCDCGNCFKGPKTTLKCLDSKSVMHLAAHADRIKKVILEQDEKFKTRGKITANYKNHMVQGLLKVVFALQQSMKPTTIMGSFEKAGIVPFDYTKILGLCDKRLSDSDFMKAHGYLEKGIKHIRKFGEISDKKLAADGFDGPSKDHLAKSKRRSIILTNKNHVGREIKKQELKAQRKEENEKKKTTRNTKAREKNKRQRIEFLEAVDGAHDSDNVDEDMVVVGGD
jgi:hypothetical protein